MPVDFNCSVSYAPAGSRKVTVDYLLSLDIFNVFNSLVNSNNVCILVDNNYNQSMILFVMCPFSEAFNVVYLSVYLYISRCEVHWCLRERGRRVWTALLLGHKWKVIINMKLCQYLFNWITNNTYSSLFRYGFN